jgi:hypothetical protein
MLDFRKKLAEECIIDSYVSLPPSDLQRSPRPASNMHHELITLPRNRKISGGHIVASKDKYPKKNALVAKKK